MVFITEEQYKKFQASKYMGLLYENKMTCNVEKDYYDKGVHYLELGQGTDDSLKDEIFDATKEYMSRVGPRAAVAYASALDDPTQLGIKEKMVAAGQILDRAGIVKTERVAVESVGGLFILPPKNSDDAETK